MNLLKPELSGVSTLVDCVRTQVELIPEKTAFSFLNDAGDISGILTYSELDRQARILAETLRTTIGPRSRLLLLFEPGLEFIAALFGCLYAGMYAVPSYPPKPTGGERTLSRLKAIAADAAPAAVLTSGRILASAKGLFTFAEDFASLPWLDVETLCNSDASPPFCDLGVLPDDLAIIQYTSGSTAVPKGVMLSHRNILVNMQMLRDVAYADPAIGRADTQIVSWLPFFHDLGLMGGIVLPIILGGHAVLMSPFGFLRRPALWLTAISRFQAASTFVPNFALDIAVRKVTGAEREALDLSSLRICVVGAEPVHHRSVERFIRAFAKQGVARASLLPGYGLAEAVVGATGGPLTETPRSLFIDRKALSRHRFETVSSSHADASPLVSCGRPLGGVDMIIVDPDKRLPLGPGAIGEVWMRGPHVALGYWQRESDNRETFQARLADGPAQDWLRTGDLGCLDDGHLYITGRIKDLIIIRGRNHYPQDIEATVEGCHPRVMPGATIAFSYEEEGVEQVAVVAEVDSRKLQDKAEKEEAFHAIAAAIRSALGAEHQLQAHGIVFVGIGRIEKTSSGKLARQLCKQRYLDHALKTEFIWTFHMAIGKSDPQAARPSSQLQPAEQRSALITWLSQEIARLAGRGDDLPSADENLDEAGLDSLATMELASQIDRRFGLTLPAAALLGSTTIAELAELVEQTERGEQTFAAARQATHIMAKRGWALPAPLFCIGGAGGAVAYLSHLDAALEASRPLIGFQAPGLDGSEPPLGSIEELALHYIEDIKAIQPHGPYALIGHSFGGLVAYEITRQLSERGETVAPLMLIDTTLLEYGGAHEETDEVMARYELGVMDRHFSEPSAGVTGNRAETSGAAAHVLSVYQTNYAAMERYQPLPYGGPVTLFRAREGLPKQAMHPARRTKLHFGTRALGWNRLCPALDIVDAEGDHFSLVMPPHAPSLAGKIDAALAAHPPMRVGLERLRAARHLRSARRIFETTADGPIIDAYHPGFISNPYPYLRQVQEHAPIHRDARSQWWVTRYADVSSGLRDRRFSADPGKLAAAIDSTGTASWYEHQQMSPLARVYANFMPFTDPPRHHQLRQLFAPTFTPVGAQQWRSYIEELVDELIAEMREKRDPDIVRDLAQPLTVRVAAELLGFPPEDVAFLVPWGRDLAFGFDAIVSDEDARRVNRSAEGFMRYLRDQAARWRTSSTAPRKGGARVKGAAILDSGLDPEDLLAAYAMVFMAAFETTISMVGNATLALWRNPDQRERLRQQPELAENAVDELLRYDGAVRCALRCTLDDVDIGGLTIPRGERVLFILSAANRDRRMFPAPDRLDIGRPNARQHVAFSHGVHYCLGAPLAKLELQCAMRALVQQDFALAPAPDGFEWRRSAVFRTLNSLRIAW
jgi:acyl-CoA synthetase (AMP-forming)/AMP-acid ligase II/cytochrome P450/thioesterase domain-containing protein/acyl carrier protein